MLFAESCAEVHLLGAIWWSESKVCIGRMLGEVPIGHLGDEVRLIGQIVVGDDRLRGTPRSASSQSSSAMPGGGRRNDHPDDVLSRLAPIGHKHINMRGILTFDLAR